MVAQLLVGLFADLILDSAVTLRRSFDSTMSRYLEQQGFRSTTRAKQAPAR